MAVKRGRIILKNRKAQFTLFVILGFVMLVTVLFFLYATSSIVDAQLQQEARRAVQDYLDSNAINYYVYSCMDAVVTDAIDTLALQGGVFYDYQGGPFIAQKEGVTHIPYNVTIINATGEEENISVNVSYGIVNQSLNHFMNYMPQECLHVRENKFPPAYPYPNTYLDALMDTYSASCNVPMFLHSGFFGQNIFPRLCMHSSIGGINMGALQATEYTFLSPCFGNNFRIHNLTSEHILNNYLSEKLEECIDFTVFEEAQGHEVTAIDDPVVQVLFDQDSFNVHLEYPFEVMLRGGQPVVTKYAFEYSAEQRFTRLQRYLFELIRREAQDINFDISTHYMSGSTLANLYDENMKLEVIDLIGEEYEPYEYDRMIILTDQASIVKGRPLKFMTAIQNRRPALDYINPARHPHFNIIVWENSTIQLSPRGADPDDRIVSYNYSGWMETRTEEYMFDRTVNGKPCNEPYNLDWWELYACVQTNYADPPHNWTRSTPFTNTRREAEYATNMSDLGPHNVTIVVQDQSGMIDYQTIHILVVDYPVIEVEISTAHYPAIDHGILSVEDPAFFELDIESLFLLPGDITWKFYRQTQTIDILEYEYESKYGDDGYGAFSFPREEFNINSIHIIKLDAPGNYKLNITVDFSGIMPEDGIITEEFDFEVKQCLPNTASSDPFPYNTTNAFQTSRPCCDSNYDVQGDTTLCFKAKYLGDLDSLQERITELNNKNQLLSEYFAIQGHPPPPIISPPPITGNFIYVLEYNRSCDGNRGNICAGQVSYSLDVHDDCGYNPSYTEQCGAPDFNSQPPQCNYVTMGTTVDAQNNVPGATGLCLEEPRCSSKGIGGYDDDGPFICSGATCGNDGTCDNIDTTNPLINCECSVSSCTAECDAVKDFQWVSSPTGSICRHSCNLQNSCRFDDNGGQSLPCPVGESYCQVVNTCYFNVQCGSTGGSFNQELRPTQPCDNFGETWTCGSSGWYCE